MEGHWKFLGDGGSHKPKMFKGKCEAELEFPEGWKGRGGGDLQTKKNLHGGHGYFLEQHSALCVIKP